MIPNYINKLFTKSASSGPYQSAPNIKSGSIFSDFGDFDLFKQPAISASEYSNNVIVYRCVNIIAQGASHIPWIVKDAQYDNPKNHSRNHSKTRPKNHAKDNFKDHPICNLLKRPNNMQSGAEFFSALVASKLLYGNSYIVGAGQQAGERSGNNVPQSLYLLHPNQMELKFENGSPSHYSYKQNNKETIFKINPKTRKSQVLHIKTYNPSSPYVGTASIKPASKSIELHNATSEWNSSLLKNGARPSGALVMKDSSHFLSDEQFSRLQEQLYDKFSGAKNSGKPLLLEGGLDWKDMSIHPKDMDFIESKNSAAREIALAFGLPPQLLGITGDNTYSNMQEARLALWEETIIPILDNLADAMSAWFSAWYEREIIIDFDKDGISALSAKRQATWDKVSKADFMTINEKREIVGLPPIKGGEGFVNQIHSGL